MSLFMNRLVRTFAFRPRASKKYKSIAMKAAKAQLSTASKNYLPTTTGPLVFTHHDLAPRNILLDESGRLWLVDWDIAGWYPCYFEYAAMHNFIPEHWTWFARMRWNLITWIAAGYWEKQKCELERIRFRAGRRVHLLKHGGPSRRSVDMFVLCK